MKPRFTTAPMVGAALLLLALPVHADPALLGLCSELGTTSCAAQTGWSLQESALTPTLTDPNGANASFQIVVTEGATTTSLALSDTLSLDGMIASGTDILGIFFSIQKGNAQGAYVTVASAALGDSTLR